MKNNTSPIMNEIGYGLYSEHLDFLKYPNKITNPYKAWKGVNLFKILRPASLTFAFSLYSTRTINARKNP